MNANRTAPVRAIVVDDEPLARDELSFLLGECGGVELVGEAPDATSALTLSDETNPDVAFVDLRMPGLDGITLAETLRARHPQIQIVVVSAHDDGALRAFDADVRDYLLKPVRLERLQQTLDRLQSPPCKPPILERLAVRRRGNLVVVPVEQVLHFEAKDDLVWAVTADDRYALDLTLSKLEEQVGDAFFRSHRSALVRISAIRGMEPTGAGTYDLVLDHPKELRVPLARDRARLLKRRIPVVG